MKWLATLILSAALLAPSKPLPACTPAERETWPITDRNTIVEGRTVIVHTSPDGRKKCGEVQVSNTRPQAPKKVRK